jgi:rubredoxin
MAEALTQKQKEKLQKYIRPGYMDRYLRLHTCPKCGYQVKSTSDDPLDHILWSDGVTHDEYPYSKYPELWYCPTCKLIDWSSKNRDFGYCINMEVFIRLRMWQELNNKFRPVPGKGKWCQPITITNEHREILNDLHSWMYEGNPEKALLKAEMLRQLDRFELSDQLLALIRERESKKEDRDWEYKYEKWWGVIAAHNKERSTDLALVYSDQILY